MIGVQSFLLLLFPVTLIKLHVNCHKKDTEAEMELLDIQNRQLLLLPAVSVRNARMHQKKFRQLVILGRSHDASAMRHLSKYVWIQRIKSIFGTLRHACAVMYVRLQDRDRHLHKT
jgi:hypothetical protein